MEVPLEGGKPLRLTDYAANRPAVSPDGRLIVFAYPDAPAGRYRLGLIPFEGGEIVKRFDAPLAYQQVFRWTPDGKALTYLDTRDGVTNVWRLPLDGGPPAPLTDFQSEQIFGYDLARDGGLLLSRGSVTSDVVLLRDAR